MDFPAKAAVMPNNSLRGGLKLSIGINTHINKNNTATLGVSCHLSISGMVCECFLQRNFMAWKGPTSDWNENGMTEIAYGGLRGSCDAGGKSSEKGLP